MQVASKDEIRTIDTVASISCIDPKVVRKVFEGIAIHSAMEVYRGKSEFTYPFLGKVKLSFYDEMETSNKVIKKSNGAIDLFNEYSETMGLAKQGVYRHIVDFIKNRYKKTLHGVLED